MKFDDNVYQRYYAHVLSNVPKLDKIFYGPLGKDLFDKLWNYRRSYLTQPGLIMSHGIRKQSLEVADLRIHNNWKHKPLQVNSSTLKLLNTKMNKKKFKVVDFVVGEVIGLAFGYVGGKFLGKETPGVGNVMNVIKELSGVGNSNFVMPVVARERDLIFHLEYIGKMKAGGYLGSSWGAEYNLFYFRQLLLVDPYRRKDRLKCVWNLGQRYTPLCLRMSDKLENEYKKDRYSIKNFNITDPIKNYGCS